MSDSTSYIILAMICIVVVVSNAFILAYFIKKLKRIENRKMMS